MFGIIFSGRAVRPGPARYRMYRDATPTNRIRVS